MATTFDLNLQTARDRARLALYDTGTLLDASGTPVWFFQDETLDQLLELYGYNEGLAQAAEALFMRFAQ